MLRRDPIYFVCHHLRRRWPELDHERAFVAFGSVPKTRWAPLENIWIVSTYLRLQAAGQDVRITDRPVADAINICCDVGIPAAGIDSSCFVVTTQGDRARQNWGDFHLVQSPEQSGGSNCALIRHWPQPGLLARDPARGMRIERLGYVGPVENLGGRFLDSQFRNELAQLGVGFVIRSNPEEWHDFHDLDLYLAVRDWPWRLIRTKPATKLVHGWLTGVPALLGPEPSYRYWGKDGEDYFETRTPEDVLGVVRRLKANPEHYEAVRQCGFVKGRQHDEQAVLNQWVEILNGPVREAFERWRQAGSMARKYRAIRRRWQKLSSPVQQKWFTLRSRGWRAVKKESSDRESTAVGGGKKVTA